LRLLMRLVLMGLLVLSGCRATSSRDVSGEPDRIEEVAAELIGLAEEDQKYEQIVLQGKVPADREGFFATKARLMVERGERCEAIFDEIGFPDYEMVGKDASEAFWLLVQHTDSDPEFQERVVEAMRPAVDRGAADGLNLAFLTDRVLVNTGRGQKYGTQVDYEHAIGRAFPKLLDAPELVDERRDEVGLEPLAEYMNSMCEIYFMMNRKQLGERGVEAAYQYPDGFDSW